MKTYKKLFQPIEIALKKTLGIKLVKKAELFDERGFVKDGYCKFTRYVLFIPVAQKMRQIIRADKLAYSFENGGGGVALF